MNKVLWEPQLGPQTELIRCPVFEVFYGGARGGGKTEGSIGDWLDHSGTYGEAAIGVFFRRKFKQLEEVVARTKQLFPKIGGKYNEQKAEWTMPNGARLKFRYIERDSDAQELLHIHRAAEQSIKRLATGILKHQRHAIIASDERLRPSCPGRVERGPERVFVFKPFDALASGVFLVGHDQQDRVAAAVGTTVKGEFALSQLRKQVAGKFRHGGQSSSPWRPATSAVASRLTPGASLYHFLQR